MSRLYEKLTDGTWSLKGAVDEFLRDGTWPSISKTFYQQFTFRDISKVNDMVLGICTWSSMGEHYPDEAVAYVGYRQDVKTPSGATLLSPIILKELWDINCKDESELWEEYSIYEPLPKERWWHRKKYRISPQRERLVGKNTLESALLTARIRAENISGITSDIEKRLQDVIKEIKYRDQALEEIGVRTTPVN